MFWKKSWAAYRWAPSSSFQERKITLSSWEARLVESLNFYFWLDWFSSLKIFLPQNFIRKEKMFLFPLVMWTEKRGNPTIWNLETKNFLTTFEQETRNLWNTSIGGRQQWEVRTDRRYLSEHPEIELAHLEVATGNIASFFNAHKSSNTDVIQQKQQ